MVFFVNKEMVRTIWFINTHANSVHLFMLLLSWSLIFYFFLYYCFEESQSVPVKITKSPKSVRAELNNEVNLTCEASGDPPISYHWERDGQILPEKVFPNLLIPRVAPKDRGAYVCIASNTWSNSSSKPALVTIRGEIVPSQTTVQAKYNICM